MGIPKMIDPREFEVDDIKDSSEDDVKSGILFAYISSVYRRLEKGEKQTMDKDASRLKQESDQAKGI